jgi:2-dehydro-3-deoxygalactonokinase
MNQATQALQVPALIALDWGSTSVRAMLVSSEGVVVSRRASSMGVAHVPKSGFEAALLELCGDWVSDLDLPMLASGMIGSRQGWREAPYLAAPCGPAECATHLTAIRLASAPEKAIHLVPGVSLTRADGTRDVMRGEEVQVWGCPAAGASSFVLPGTHSKWVELDEQGRIVAFRTYMTGELFSVLRAHSTLRWQASETASAVRADGDFELGVKRALASSSCLSSLIFQARAGALFGDVPAHGVAAFLSGLLIGAEVASALHEGTPNRSVVKVIGDLALCQLYETALRLCSVAAQVLDASDATTRCLFRIAGAAGLLQGAGR